MVAPVDGRGTLDCDFGQTGAGRIEIRAADTKGMMAAA